MRHLCAYDHALQRYCKIYCQLQKLYESFFVCMYVNLCQRNIEWV